MAPQGKKQYGGYGGYDGYKKHKHRPYCLCSKPGCEEWRFADKLSREALRCKSGHLFRTEHMPEELLAAHKLLAANDKLKDKNQKPADKQSKPPEVFEIGSDAEMEDAAAADQSLEEVRKSLEEKSAKVDVLTEFGIAIPPELAKEVEELRGRLSKPESEEDDSGINELRKVVNKASSKAHQAKESHKKNLEKTKILRQQLEDMEATNELSAQAAEEAQKLFAEATDNLNQSIKEAQAKKPKQKDVPVPQEEVAADDQTSIRKELAAKDREIAELKALMRKYLDKTAAPPPPPRPRGSCYTRLECKSVRRKRGGRRRRK